MKTKLLKKLRKIGREQININSVSKNWNGTVIGMSIGFDNKEYSGLFEYGDTVDDVLKKAERIYLIRNSNAIRQKYEAFSRKYRQKKKYKSYTTANIAYLVKRREYCKLALFLVRTFILFPIILILIVGMVLPGILIFHIGKILEIIGLFMTLRPQEAKDEIWDIWNTRLSHYLPTFGGRK